jgi:hypothetical protein
MTTATSGLLLATCSLALAAGCGGDGSTADAQAGADLPKGAEPMELDPGDFTTEIDNRYWPMKPGTRWTYRELDEEGRTLTVVTTVSSETKKLANGITARVVRDTVTEDGEVVEDTFDWYAQDGRGNIWYLGEDTAEFEEGTLTTRSGSWEAGVDGALARVAIPADPVDDMQYRQEYYEGEAEDVGEVLSTEEQAQVPAGHYTNALLTKDTSALEPNVLEYKLYAPSVGPVLSLGVSRAGDREELLKVEAVGDSAARAAATTPLGRRYA